MNPWGKISKSFTGLFMKGKNKLFARILVFGSAFVSFVFLAAFLVLYIYVKKNVDYSKDEMLFDSKQYSGATRLYYDDQGILTEYAVLSASDSKRLWCSYSDIPEEMKNAFGK